MDLVQIECVIPKMFMLVDSIFSDHPYFFFQETHHREDFKVRTIFQIQSILITQVTQTRPCISRNDPNKYITASSIFHVKLIFQPTIATNSLETNYFGFSNGCGKIFKNRACQTHPISSGPSRPATWSRARRATAQPTTSQPPTRQRRCGPRSSVSVAPSPATLWAARPSCP